MGMGEPLANYRNVVPAMRIFMDDLGYDLSRRRVTLSTSGLVPQIYKLAEECNVALAVSLHAPNDALRNELVPINRKHPIAELLAACWHYIDKQNGRSVTFEYVMLDGINDRPEHAQGIGAPAARPAGETQFDSLQRVSGHALSMLACGHDLAVPRHSQRARRDRDHAPHARRRHRCGVRPARGQGQGSHPGAARRQIDGASRMHGGGPMSRSATRRGAVGAGR